MKTNEKKKGSKFIKALIAAVLAAATIGACVACEPEEPTNAASSGQNTQPIKVPEDL